MLGAVQFCGHALVLELVPPSLRGEGSYAFKIILVFSDFPGLFQSLFFSSAEVD